MQVYLRLPDKCTSKTRFPISGDVTRMLRHFCGLNIASHDLQFQPDLTIILQDRNLPVNVWFEHF